MISDGFVYALFILPTVDRNLRRCHLLNDIIIIMVCRYNIKPNNEKIFEF